MASRCRAFVAVGLEQAPQQSPADRRSVSGDQEHVALEAREGAARGRSRVAGAARLGLYGHLDALERILRSGRGHYHERLGLELADGVDDPVDEAPSEQRMQVFRRLRAHARAEPGG